MDMTRPPMGQIQQPGNDRQRLPLVVPPAYPDPETWRRFGLLRRQLERTDRTPTPVSVTAKQL